MGPAPTGAFSAVNPMLAAKNAVIKENFVPSAESMNEIADSIKLPVIPTATLREAKAASPQPST
jgi:hypothetical protein